MVTDVITEWNHFVLLDDFSVTVKNFQAKFLRHAEKYFSHRISSNHYPFNEQKGSSKVSR